MLVPKMQIFMAKIPHLTYLRCTVYEMLFFSVKLLGS